MKQLLLLVSMLVLAAILYVGGMLLLGIATKFKPRPEESTETVAPASAQTPAVIPDSTLSFLIWNVGYGGLGAEVDFFYDGGKMVTSPREHVLKNNEGLKKQIAANSDADFVLLQEVDRNSKRSYKTDQAAQFAEVLAIHNYTFTPNYDVQFLPFPFTARIGKVYGGLQTLSKFTPQESKRIALPGISDFPRKLFYLERCLLLQRYKLANGKELVLINTHFEAYDDGGVKKQQMALTKKYAEAEFAKGNYVIIGGDWNIAPPDFDVHTWETEKVDDPLYQLKNDANYIPGWKYVYDPSTPTNRKNHTAYIKGKTYTTIIDYYYVSPNVAVKEVKTQNLDFAFSDHQPVRMTVVLQ